MLSELVSSEASLPGLQMDTFFAVSSHGLPFVCAGREVSGVSSSSYKDTSPTRLESHSYGLI